MTPNSFNFLYCSNAEQPVGIEPGDRRFTFFHQTKPLDKVLGATLAADRLGAQTQLRAFAAHLLQRQVKVTYGQLHQNTAREVQRTIQAPTSVQFWRAVQEEGWPAIGAEWEGAAGFNETRNATYESQKHGHVVLAKTIRDVYQHWCTLNRRAIQVDDNHKLHPNAMKVVGIQAEGVTVREANNARAWVALPGVPKSLRLVERGQTGAFPSENQTPEHVLLAFASKPDEEWDRRVGATQ
jgi:hypothetical protein